MKALSRPAVSSALRTLAVVAALAALLAQVLAHLGPGARAAAAWNSDSAIPLLQANDPVLDAFRLYYYGQDRLGAWPWLLAQALHGLSGFAWSPQRLFVWHASFVLGACLVLLRLHRAAGLALAAAFAALALLAPSVRALLFDVGQPYGWQLTALLLAGWGLDRLVRALALPGAPRLRWAALATVGAVLACWTSPLSGPLLLALLGPQVLRAGAAGAPRGRLAWALVPVLAAVAFERILRGAYHRFSRDHFGHDYRTALQGDWGHLLENARAMGMRALQEDAGPVFVLGLAAALATAGVLLTRARRGSLGSFVSNDAQDAHAALGFLALGFAGAALVNLAAVAASLHVRLNEYSPRYLVPTFVLGALAAASGGLFLLGLLPALRRRLGALSALLALGLTGAALAGVPAWREAPELAQAQAAQALLRARAPAGAVLLGGYWDSYLVAALDPEQRLPTLAVDGQSQRTPFLLPRLREASTVLLVRREGAQDAAAFAPLLLQHRVPLLREEEAWAASGPYRFARYRSLLSQALPVRLEEQPRRFTPCQPGSSLTVHLERPLARSGVLLVTAEAPGSGVQVEAPGAAEVRLEQGERLWLVHLRAGAEPLRRVTLRVRPETATGECYFGGVAVLDAASLP